MPTLTVAEPLILDNDTTDQPVTRSRPVTDDAPVDTPLLYLSLSPSDIGFERSISLVKLKGSSGQNTHTA